MNKELLDYFNNDELAANVWLSKYAQEEETSPDQMHKRLAKEFARIEYKYKESESKSKLENLSNYGKSLNKKLRVATPKEINDHIYKLFKDFKYIIPQGSIMATLGTNTIASLSNCWVAASPLDSYGGILKTDGDLAYYYKRRGGVGTDLSNIRPKGTKTNNSAKSTTGVVRFMHRFSNTTREVAMEGRRGALMLSLDVNHPDIMDFIKVKRDGVSVTGANISIKLNDEFMKAVENDEDYILRFPCDFVVSEDFWKNKVVCYNDLHADKIEDTVVYYKRIKAKEYWNEIIKSAKNYAEPGLMYWDNMLNYDPATVYPQFKPTCSNPCVIGDTEIYTQEGYIKIKDVINKEVSVWNGYEWSKVIPKVTGYNQHILKVTLSDGRELICTDYHKWVLENGKRTETINLKIGDKLAKYTFPVYDYLNTKSIDDKIAYTQGFISAEGMDNYNLLWLYEPKYVCENRLVEGEYSKDYLLFSGVKRKSFKFKQEFENKCFVPFDWDKSSILQWLSGLFDGDGTELNNGGLQLWSIDKTFLINVQKLLTLVGVNSKVLDAKEEQMKLLPNGKGGNKEYLCQKSYRICIGALEIQNLINIGLKCERLFFNKFPNRSAQRFVTIKSIEDAGHADEVYCYTDFINHTGVFNGIMTANCGEQFLNPNDSCRLMVLNLFSFVENPFTAKAEINYKKLYEIAYEHARLGDDLVDLELEYIQRIIDKIKSDPEPIEIKRNELELWEKSYENTKAGRRIGLGITALADMLAALNLKYDSEEALEIIDKVMSTKMEAELDCTIDLSILRGSFKGWGPSKEYYWDKDDIPGFRDWDEGKNKFYKFLDNKFYQQASRMRNYGRRSVSWSTIAPTGTVNKIAA